MGVLFCKINLVTFTLFTERQDCLLSRRERTRDPTTSTLNDDILLRLSLVVIIFLKASLSTFALLKK
jgi:hypothetical protein